MIMTGEITRDHTQITSNQNKGNEEAGAGEEEEMTRRPLETEAREENTLIIQLFTIPKSGALKSHSRGLLIRRPHLGPPRL